MRASHKIGFVTRCVLALESHVNAIYEFLDRKLPETTDISESKDPENRCQETNTERDFEDQDDVFGHRAWLAKQNDVAIGNQLFEENK